MAMGIWASFAWVNKVADFRILVKNIFLPMAFVSFLTSDFILDIVNALRGVKNEVFKFILLFYLKVYCL
jgi:hypothetical protein